MNESKRYRVTESRRRIFDDADLSKRWQDSAQCSRRDTPREPCEVTLQGREFFASFIGCVLAECEISDESKR